MKKLILIILCAVTAIAARAQYSGSGSGTESDPYLIFNPTQLAQMANFLNNENVVFELKNDINLTEFISDNYPNEGWAPIGVASSPFKGTLKGNSRTISGLSINRAGTDYVGLFGYIDGARIENLSILATSIKGGNHIGVLAGYAENSTLNTFYVTVTNGVTGKDYVGGFVAHVVNTTINTARVEIAGTGVKGTDYVGGLFGDSSGECENAVAISVVSGQAYVGGIAGSTSANFTSSKATGNISGSSTYVGGFAGNTNASTFTTCEHIGNVTGAGRVSGFCGNAEEAPTFADCKSKGTITSTGDYTGGILGYGDLVSMTNCSHFGDIQGTNYVGGVYGGNPPQTQEDYPVYYRSTSTTSNSKSTSWTNTSSFTQGTVNTRSINKCTAIGNINGTQKIGGLVGSHEAGRTFRFSSAGPSNSGGTFVGGSYYSYLWRGNACVYSFSSNYFSPTDYVDYTTLNVANSYYSGNVTGTDDVGGLIGYKISGEIKNCYAYANVVGETNVGGLIGSVRSLQVSDYGTLTIKSSAAINTTVNATKENVGRIYGYKADDYVIIGALGTADGNLSLNRTSVVKSGVVQTITDDLQNGTSIGPSMLKLKATYVAKGWDFDNDWTIQETESYPYMRYQTAPPVIESNLISQATSVRGKSVDGGTVYLYYKDNAPLSQNCDATHNWNFSTQALQSGAEVRLYAEADGLTPSYFTTATVAYPGSGTEDDPYLIFTAEDLQGVSKQGYYKVKNDIDLTSWIAENSPTKGWVSIGRNGTEATYIDGDNHKITGLWTNTTEDYTGLFSNFSRGSIKNLTIEVASGKQVKGGNYTGILIGRNANGIIQNVTIKGDVQGTEYVGGVMGYSDNNTITAATYNGAINSSSSNARLGGLAGCAVDNTVSSCRMTTKISASGSNVYAGGLFGSAAGTVTKTVAVCDIATTGENNYVGGLFGNGSLAVQQSSASGTVSATGAGSYAGGIAAYTTSEIADSYSTVTVTGVDYAAGIVAYSTSTINRCYAKGDVFGVKQGGGVAGQLDGTAAGVTNSIAANNQLTFSDQSSWASRVIGGYKNGAADPDNSNYALKTMQVTLNGVATKKYDDLVEGIAKTDTELMSAATYTALGWDLNSVWEIEDGLSYPTLACEEGSTEPSDPTPTPSDDDKDTDISQYDNIVYINNVEARAGSQTTLSVQLKNIADIYGYQFNLYLPTGCTIPTTTDAFGDVVIAASQTETRTNSSRHTFETRLNSNVLTVLCYSASAKSFVGSEGEVAQITINIPEGMAVGDYPIVIKDLVLSKANNMTENIERVKSTLTISNTKLGDANCDGFVNVGDITAIATYILGDTPVPFDMKAADADENNMINVGDITTVASMILGGTTRAVTRSGASEDAMVELSNVGVAVDQNRFAIIPVEVVNTDGCFSAFQMDIKLPQGFHLSSIEPATDRIPGSAFFDYALIEDDTYRVLSYSLGSKIRRTEGALMYLRVTVDDYLTDGVYNINLDNCIFSDNSTTLSATGSIKILVATGTTGIEEINQYEKTTVYSLDGQIICSGNSAAECLGLLPKGTYLINGKKVIK